MGQSRRRLGRRRELGAAGDADVMIHALSPGERSIGGESPARRPAAAAPARPGYRRQSAGTRGSGATGRSSRTAVPARPSPASPWRRGGRRALKAQEPGNLLRRQADLLPKAGDEPFRTPAKLVGQRRDRNAAAGSGQLPPGPGHFRRWVAGIASTGRRARRRARRTGRPSSAPLATAPPTRPPMRRTDRSSGDGAVGQGIHRLTQEPVCAERGEAQLDACLAAGGLGQRVGLVQPGDEAAAGGDDAEAPTAVARPAAARRD